MRGSLWQKCVRRLEEELPAQQFNTWIRPLHAVENDSTITLLAPNKFVSEWINEQLLGRIEQIANSIGEGLKLQIRVQVGSKKLATDVAKIPSSAPKQTFRRVRDKDAASVNSNLNKDFTFDTFVEGKSNQLVRAVSI